VTWDQYLIWYQTKFIKSNALKLIYFVCLIQHGALLGSDELK